MSTWLHNVNKVMDLLAKNPDWTLHRAICNLIPDCTMFVGKRLVFGVLECLPIEELKRRVKLKEFTKDHDDEWEIIERRIK